VGWACAGLIDEGFCERFTEMRREDKNVRILFPISDYMITEFRVLIAIKATLGDSIRARASFYSSPSSCDSRVARAQFPGNLIFYIGTDGRMCIQSMKRLFPLRGRYHRKPH